MKRQATLIALSFLFLNLYIATAQEYSIDISGLENEEYNSGEEIIFKIILLEDESSIEREVTYKLTDALNKKEITGTITSNQETSIKVEEDFLSGIWTITANYEEAQVKRTFLVGENSEVEFLLEGDELIIRNKGNIRYTKTVQITIGSETNAYVQNIKAGDEKTLKLISTDGKYNIEVTDGKTTLKREDVQLFGTGNVIGAVDKELVGYTGFAGAEEVANAENGQVSLTKLPLSIIFIIIIGMLTALVFAQKKLTGKKK
ncbi:hypothetical protein HN682_01880 [Candidatus Peregrinibacteria bacterium]|jgi:hypothetical protein|nr:hypothetical protein [Candidatus Peregrinibacteria bacterium]